MNDTHEPASTDAELLLLREFYCRWRAMHAIPRQAVNRGKMERAAQELVDASHRLRLLYEGAGEASVHQTVMRKLQLVESSNG